MNLLVHHHHCQVPQTPAYLLLTFQIIWLIYFVIPISGYRCHDNYYCKLPERSCLYFTQESTPSAADEIRHHLKIRPKKLKIMQNLLFYHSGPIWHSFHLWSGFNMVCMVWWTGWVALAYVLSLLVILATEQCAIILFMYMSLFYIPKLCIHLNCVSCVFVFGDSISPCFLCIAQSFPSVSSIWSCTVDKQKKTRYTSGIWLKVMTS